jgi:hypothetical protein
MTVEIFKGRRQSIKSSQAFLMRGKGGTVLPYRREAGAGRYPIKHLTTLSVPQMVENTLVRSNIDKQIRDGMLKRLEHHTERQMGK